jgi:hypothetical protein
MANLKGQSALVGQLLKFELEQPYTRTIGTAAIGRDHLWISFTAHHIQPGPDRIDRELCRVVVYTDAEAAGIGRDIVDPIGDDFTKLFVNEVMHIDLVGTAFRSRGASAVLVATDWLLLLRTIEITG